MSISAKNMKYSSVVRACMYYLDAHILEKIHMRNVARQIGYSGYYVTSQFKKEVGISATEYII